ncbi:MAG: glycosyltransferase 87 family protein [Candidatus Eremiobacterota bacterium]
MKKKDKINYITLIIIPGFIFSAIYIYITGVYRDMPYPFNTFLFRPDDRFMDFFSMVSATEHYSPYIEGKGCYFPFCYVIIYLFTFLSKNISFIFFLIIFTISFFYLSVKYLHVNDMAETLKNSAIFIFLTYPFLISIDRGNFEVFVFIFLSFFMFFYIRRKYFISILFLSFATSMKVFPGVFFILLLSDKRYKELLYSLILISLLTIVPLLTFKGGFSNNLHAMVQNQKSYNGKYTMSSEGLYFGHSFAGMIKIILATGEKVTITDDTLERLKNKEWYEITADTIANLKNKISDDKIETIKAMRLQHFSERKSKLIALLKDMKFSEEKIKEIVNHAIMLRHPVFSSRDELNDIFTVLKFSEEDINIIAEHSKTTMAPEKLDIIKSLKNKPVHSCGQLAEMMKEAGFRKKEIEISTNLLASCNNKIKIPVTLITLWSIIIFIFITCYVIFIETDTWKKAALLICSMNLLPPVSGDYKLIHMFIPIFLFINSDKKDSCDFIYIVLFSFLLIPKSFYHFNFIPGANPYECNIGTVINPVVMILIMLLITGTGIRTYILSLKNKAA